MVLQRVYLYRLGRPASDNAAAPRSASRRPRGGPRRPRGGPTTFYNYTLCKASLYLSSSESLNKRSHNSTTSIYWKCCVRAKPFAVPFFPDYISTLCMLESRANSKRVSRTLIYVSVATVSSKDFNSHRQSQGSRNKDSNKSFSPLLDFK